VKSCGQQHTAISVVLMETQVTWRLGSATSCVVVHQPQREPLRIVVQASSISDAYLQHLNSVLFNDLDLGRSLYSGRVDRSCYNDRLLPGVAWSLHSFCRCQSFFAAGSLRWAQQKSLLGACIRSTNKRCRGNILHLRHVEV